ncbi:degenerin mec-10-like [Biomphalaria glabrata]|uniref:Degenerin mec-10-like n=2 Tax=Biomphalaria glabrata TaxID=6526 RepID=A0A9W3BGR6_BIOGL|nr:degenerin mec-10-like [Biomphalaria glabrata]
MELPFITFCNQNPVRSSKLKDTSPGLVQYVQNKSLDKLVEIISKYNTSKSSETNEIWINLLSTYLQDDKSDKGSSGDMTVQSELVGFERFVYEMNRLDSEVRKEAGHQIDDMLLWCFIGGDSCNVSDFKLFSSNEFGNCFTLNTLKYRQESEGPKEGLDIGFFLEPDEYIPELIETKGLQVVLHSKQSFPYPKEDGFQVSPGTLSNIAMKLVKTQYLPKPYGDCLENCNYDRNYLQDYNYTYEYEFCQDLCRYNYVIEKCRCMPKEYLEITGDEKVSGFCSDNLKSYLCQNDVYTGVYNNTLTCDECDDECSTETYTFRMTSSEWPTSILGQALVEYLCNKTSMTPERCQSMRNHTDVQLRENFVALKSFYDTMSVETYSVQPAMSITDLLCNVGGCLGLWLGLSVLSFCEVFHFVVELLQAALQMFSLCPTKPKM